jgi:hypothetical protein
VPAIRRREPETQPQTPAVEVSASSAARPAPKKKLSDRELFELMQAGKPLPVIDDPTTESSGGGDERRERAPRRERGERSERGERRERRPREEVEVAPGNLRLWVNLGKADGVSDDAALGSALGALGAPSDKVAKLELRGTYSYVHVAEGDAPTFEALAGKQHGEKPLKIERARR